jgi:ABC-type branched-subunit amino acid transport system substrate-binding protein
LADAVERKGRVLTEAELDALIAIADAVAASDLRELPGKTEASAIVDLRFALVLHHKGDNAGVRRQLRRAEHAKRLGPHIDALRARLEVVPVDAAKVAVLLPMSGKFAAIGEELWAGMSLAQDPESPALVTVYDTLGTEEGAANAVRQALAAGSILAIGPAGRLESRAAARVAAAANLPIALMAPASSAANAETGVFRLALSPSFEAEQAAIVAVELGYRLLAVMTPRDELGRKQARAFIKMAHASGAAVVSQGSYDPSGANMEQDFKKFLEIEATVNPRYRRHLRTYGKKSWKSFTPTLPFDFLYIPDTVERGTLAASYLPFFNVELRTHDDMSITRLRTKHRGLMPRVVQLMGGSSWLDPSLSARGGAAVEGALVIGTCPGGHGMDLSERGRSFEAAFRRLQGRTPSAAAATANDAMNMVLQVRDWAAKHGGQRADAARAMRSAQLRDGVCGTQTMHASGQIEGEIEVLRVEQGNLEIYGY